METQETESPSPWSDPKDDWNHNIDSWQTSVAETKMCESVFQCDSK